MAGPTSSPGAGLYNNARLSDVKILQTYNKVTKEYLAHKAILANRSEWFAKAFFGNFKEATADKIELHEDNPEYFEIMMKYFYHSGETNVLVAKDGSALSRMAVVGIHNLADKYGFKLLKDDIAKKYPTEWQPLMQLVEVVKCHYDHCFDKQCALGKSIAADVVNWKNSRNPGLTFLNSHGAQLVTAYPKFARDLMLAKFI